MIPKALADTRKQVKKENRNDLVLEGHWQASQEFVCKFSLKDQIKSTGKKSNCATILPSPVNQPVRRWNGLSE